MKLTDAERAEYLALTENTYDPELSSEVLDGSQAALNRSKA
jgi:hypothetical protein